MIQVLRTSNLIRFTVAVLAFCFFSSCAKDVLDKFPGNANQGGGKVDTVKTSPIPDTSKIPVPRPLADSVIVRVRAIVQVGDITYDSIPARLLFTSFDSANVAHSRTLNLMPGVNQIKVPKAHIAYQLRLSAFGQTLEQSIVAAEYNPAMVIEFNGSRQPKRLSKEESYRMIDGQAVPDGQTFYEYAANNRLSRIVYYKKFPHSADLQLDFSEQYNYESGRLKIINLYTYYNERMGFIEFVYDGSGRITNMHQEMSGQHTYAAVNHALFNGEGSIGIDYLYHTGHAMEYVMEFSGGNKVSEAGTTSAGKSEGGGFTYDHYINPYAHMGMLNIYLSNLSKNNLVGQQKGYSGSIPSAVPYKYEYKYDADGYPVELLKSFRSYLDGKHLYQIKTVYTY